MHLKPQIIKKWCGLENGNQTKNKTKQNELSLRLNLLFNYRQHKPDIFHVLFYHFYLILS